MRYVKIVARFAVVLGLLVLAVAFVGFDGLVSALSSLSLKVFAICVAAELLFYGIESVRIYVLGQKKIPINDILSSRLLSAFLGTFLPGLVSGDLVRVLLLGRSSRLSKVHILLLLLANRIYGVIALGIIWLIANFVMKSPQILLIPRFWLAVGNAFVLCLIFTPLLFQMRLTRRVILALIVRLPRCSQRFFKTLFMACKIFSSPGSWALASVTSALSTALIVFEFWIIGHDLGLLLDYAVWCLWVPAVGLAGFIPFGIGAVGPQDTAMLLGAQILNLPADKVLAVSLIIHSVRFIGTIPGVFWIGEIAHFLRRRKKENKVSDAIAAVPGKIS